jgi:hypothetical protein
VADFSRPHVSSNVIDGSSMPVEKFIDSLHESPVPRRLCHANTKTDERFVQFLFRDRESQIGVGSRFQATDQRFQMKSSSISFNYHFLIEMQYL